MRNPAAQGKPDSNQSELVKAYEELYCLVWDTHKVGGGFGDLVVRVGTRRGPVLQIVEVKSADGELRPNQQRFARDWGSCVVAVWTREDVIGHVEAVRRANL